MRHARNATGCRVVVGAHSLVRTESVGLGGQHGCLGIRTDEQLDISMEVDAGLHTCNH